MDGGGRNNAGKSATPSDTDATRKQQNVAVVHQRCNRGATVLWQQQVMPGEWANWEPEGGCG